MAIVNCSFDGASFRKQSQVILDWGGPSQRLATEMRTSLNFNILQPCLYLSLLESVHLPYLKSHATQCQVVVVSIRLLPRKQFDWTLSQTL